MDMTTNDRGARRAFLGQAMSPEQLTEFMLREKTCRIGTISRRGIHLTATGFVWDGTSVWIPSAVKTQRLRDVARDPHVTVLVDSVLGPSAGFAEFVGEAEIVGVVPRGSQPDVVLDPVEGLLVAKYGIPLATIHQGAASPMGGHAWIRVEPSRIVSSAGRPTEE
jgi:hypothetical protein